MRTSDPTSIVSRYACLDFEKLPGFPNLLPLDEYLLRNGHKFMLVVTLILNFVLCFMLYRSLMIV